MITSTLKRAVETANNIFEITSIPIIAQENNLRERYYGDYRLVACTNQTPSDAESPQAFQKCAKNILNKVLFEDYAATPLIIVSHQKVFEYISELLIKHTKRLPPGRIAHFTYHKHQNWNLEMLDMVHLSGMILSE
jgi:broad specificity phosphatase PhoE